MNDLYQKKGWPRAVTHTILFGVCFCFEFD